MKFKPVPGAPDDVAFVGRAQRAVPRVPDSEDDCCVRLVARLGLPGRDAASTWLTFLRALELVEETERGFRRTRVDPTPAHVREAFDRRVFAADAVRSALDGADRPLTAAEAFERVRETIPVWERNSDPQWETGWRERVGDVLSWLVLLGGAERVDGDGDGPRYRSV